MYFSAGRNTIYNFVFGELAFYAGEHSTAAAAENVVRTLVDAGMIIPPGTTGFNIAYGSLQALRNDGKNHLCIARWAHEVPDDVHEMNEHLFDMLRSQVESTTNLWHKTEAYFPVYDSFCYISALLKKNQSCKYFRMNVQLEHRETWLRELAERVGPVELLHVASMASTRLYNNQM